VIEVLCALRHAEVKIVGSRRGLERQDHRSSRKKKTKAQLSRARKRSRGSKVGSCSSKFSVKLQSGFAVSWSSENAAAKQLCSELGNEVSGVVEKLSRKIHIETTKSYGFGVVSVYL
jgi:hypothetical protein